MIEQSRISTVRKLVEYRGRTVLGKHLPKCSSRQAALVDYDLACNPQVALCDAVQL